MKVGVNVAVNSETGDIGALAKKAEDLGFQSLWMAEHPIIPYHIQVRRHPGRQHSPIHE